MTAVVSQSAGSKVNLYTTKKTTKLLGGLIKQMYNVRQEYIREGTQLHTVVQSTSFPTV